MKLHPFPNGLDLPHDAVRWFQLLAAAVGLSVAAPPYRDITIDPLGLYDGGFALGYAALSTNLLVRAFPAASDRYLYFKARLGNDYRNGTAIKPWFEWVPTSTSTANVRWELEYEIEKAGSGSFATTSSEGTTQAGGGTANRIQRVTSLADISGSGVVKGSTILGRISRLGSAVADTYPDDAGLLSLGFKYLIDGVGEREAHP